MEIDVTDMKDKETRLISLTWKNRFSIFLTGEIKVEMNRLTPFKPNKNICRFCKGTGKLKITEVDGTITDGICPQYYKPDTKEKTIKEKDIPPFLDGYEQGLKDSSQQKPDVKGKKARRNGGGEFTESFDRNSEINSGCENGGSASKYPSADTHGCGKMFISCTGIKMPCGELSGGNIQLCDNCLDIEHYEDTILGDGDPSMCGCAVCHWTEEDYKKAKEKQKEDSNDKI